jgi:hypothetical protein
MRTTAYVLRQLIVVRVVGGPRVRINGSRRDRGTSDIFFVAVRQGLKSA